VLLLKLLPVHLSAAGAPPLLVASTSKMGLAGLQNPSRGGLDHTAAAL
jgi:hypothetical protein